MIAQLCNIWELQSTCCHMYVTSWNCQQELSCSCPVMSGRNCYRPRHYMHAVQKTLVMDLENVYNILLPPLLAL